jgi:plastocyanin
MKYLIPILIITLLFISACGNEDNESSNSTDNLSNDEMNVEQTSNSKTEVVEKIQCPKDEVNIEGECLPIDPYNVLSEDESEQVVEEQVVEEVVLDSKSDVKTFTIVSDNYEFYIDGVENPQIRVNLGDNVTIKFSSIEGSHSWNVAKLAARSKTVSTNESTTLNFIANIQGTFDYYCAVGRHQNIGQKGKFIVE